jgi:hypothetical protein
MAVNIRMAERPDAPYNQLTNRTRDLKGTQEYSGTSLSRHHVIPYNVLRDFWNRLLFIDQNYSIAKGFLEEIAKNIARYPTNYGRVDIQWVADAARSIGNGELNQLTNEAFDSFRAVYAWLPGNLFEGPDENIRTDDPGGRFECGAGSIVGDPFNALQTACRDMREYTRNGDRGLARKIMPTLVALARRTTIIKLDRTKWIRGGVTDRGQMYYIKQAGKVTRTVSDVPIVGRQVVLAAGPVPAGQIRIGDKTVTLTVIGSDSTVVYERGEASDIGFRELADWVATQFGAEVPDELTSITIRYLSVDVFTTLSERTIQFVVVIDFQLSGTTVDLMADLVCTRTGNFGTDFTLRVGIGVALSDDNHLWFDGIVRRATATTTALAAT